MVDTSKVHPDILRALNNTILPVMEAFGHPMRVCQGARTAEQQHELWRQGREIPGPNPTPQRPLGGIVTKCDGYTIPGPHQIKGDGYGHAVDCCFLTDPFGEKQPWSVFGALGVWCGLKWGGNWAGSLIDRPHLELPPKESR